MRKMILDLDVGVDDALAIAYALGSPEVELVGITTTFGNVTTSRSTANALAVLELLGHPEVPVHQGLTHALRSEDFSVSSETRQIHGVNGLGGADIPVSGLRPASHDAVGFILESARRWGRDLVIVPTGPATNLARALEIDPAAVHGVGSVVMMGGALTVPGNVSPVAEANIAQDPEAADRVLRAGLPLTMVGLDVTLETILTCSHTARWRRIGSRGATLMASMADGYIAAYAERSPHLGGCGLHDPLACAVAVDPSLVGCLSLPMMVELEGCCRGRTVGDPVGRRQGARPVAVAVTVDAGRFLALFMERVGRVLAEAQ